MQHARVPSPSASIARISARTFSRSGPATRTRQTRSHKGSWARSAHWSLGHALRSCVSRGFAAQVGRTRDALPRDAVGGRFADRKARRLERGGGPSPHFSSSDAVTPEHPSRPGAKVSTTQPDGCIDRRAAVLRNPEVAHVRYRPHRKEDPASRPSLARLARSHGQRRVRRVVRHAVRGAVRAGRDDERANGPHHGRPRSRDAAEGLRGDALRDHHRPDRARDPVLLPLAPARDRLPETSTIRESQRRLHCVHAVEEAEGGVLL